MTSQHEVLRLGYPELCLDHFLILIDFGCIIFLTFIFIKFKVVFLFPKKLCSSSIYKNINIFTFDCFVQIILYEVAFLFPKY